MLVGGTNKKKTVRYELDVTARDTVSSDCYMSAALAYYDSLRALHADESITD